MTPTNRRFFRFVAAASTVSTALILSACGGGDGSGSVAAGPNGTKTISIAVTQWPSLAFSVPYQVAMEKGYFTKAGVTIKKVIASQGGGTTVRSILGGDLAFGEVATSALVESQKAGSALVAVGGGAQKVGEIVWVAPRSSPIDSIKDLSGKAVGYTNAGSVTQSTLAISLKRAGVDPATVKQRATGGVSEGLTAMEGGAIDATIHADPVYAAHAENYKLLWRASDYISDYQQTVIVTSPTLIKKDPALVTAFLTARAKAIDYIKKHPEDAARIWSEKGGVPRKAALTTVRKLLSIDEWNVGFNSAGLATAAEGMRDAGLIGPHETVAWDKYIDQGLLPQGVAKIRLP